MGFIKLQLSVHADFHEADELYWDRFIPKFRRMVDMAEQIAEIDSRRGGNQHPCIPIFEFAPSRIYMVYLVASVCRDFETRSRPLIVVSNMGRKDGVIDSASLTSFAEAKMRLETSGKDLIPLEAPKQCTCIPNEFICKYHRVRERCIEFLGSGRARLVVETFHDDAAETRVGALNVQVDEQSQLSTQGSEPLRRTPKV